MAHVMKLSKLQKYLDNILGDSKESLLMFRWEIHKNLYRNFLGEQTRNIFLEPLTENLKKYKRKIFAKSNINKIVMPHSYHLVIHQFGQFTMHAF